MNRRSFIRCSLASLATAGFLGPRLAFAQGGAGNGRVLILLNLIGGIDPLFAYPLLGQQAGILQAERPDLFIDPSSAITLGTALEVGLHQSWMPLLSVVDPATQLKLVNLLGVASPSGSHATAQSFYSLGANKAAPGAAQGWIGRLMDLYGLNAYQVWGLGTGNKIDFRTLGTSSPMLADNLAAFSRGVRAPSLGGLAETMHSDSVARLIVQRESPATYAERLLKDGAQALDQALINVAGISSQITVGTYPNSDFGQQARDAARIVRAKVNNAEPGSLIIYLQRGGFDTHGSQVATLPMLIDDVAASLRGLVADLQALGLWSGSVICGFSEFSRTVKQNGAGPDIGSDHGEATSMLLLGGGLNSSLGPVIGAIPDASMLQNYNHLPMETDFRNVFAELVTWLGFDSNAVFVEPYTTVPLGLF